MDSKKKVSLAVVRRLPRYYRYLSDLLQAGIKRISSRELSSKMGITASQIRQDLNCFGGFGQQGYGYNVELLFNEIKKIMGIETNYKTIIIGAGNIGRALANYGNFQKRGFEVVGIFDNEKSLIGTTSRGIKIMSMDNLEKYVSENKVDIAILAVPHDHTQEAADRVARCGISALWNFSPMDLQLPYDVIIENVHLSDSLMVLGYRLNEKRNREKGKE
ncbi:MAG: redox-sensing transcriptional repressor Rex [Eubacteriales bacterium]|nr:redox-sensing transcriptional repressor Rex [Eubacteriales bacterium]